MHRKFVLVLCGAALAGAGVPATVALGKSGGKKGTAVTVRVEGLKKTLLASKLVHVPKTGSITKGGAPNGACSENSGAGALDVATKHNWDGKYSTSVKDIFITKILGETESGATDFWSIFVNNVAASTGGCGIKLHKGQQLLFAAVPVTGTAFPLALKGASTVKASHTLTVTALAYDGKGKTKPLSGATIKAGKLTATTNSKGVAHFKPTKTGKLVLTASKTGYVRAELTVQVNP